MLGEINKDVKRLKCSALIIHVVGPVFKMVGLCRSKRFRFSLTRESILPLSRQGIPPKKVVLLCQ